MPAEYSLTLCGSPFRAQVARLTGEVSALQRSLDEARAALRQHASSEEERRRLAEEHARLLSKVNENNLLRESNMLLRTDAEKNQKRATVRDD